MCCIHKLVMEVERVIWIDSESRKTVFPIENKCELCLLLKTATFIRCSEHTHAPQRMNPVSLGELIIFPLAPPSGEKGEVSAFIPPKEDPSQLW